MNHPNDYDVNYSGSSYRAAYGHHLPPRNLEYDRGSLNSTKNDYDVDSMLSSRGAAAAGRDTSRWDRRSVAAESYDNRRLSEAPSAYSQYSRANGPSAHPGSHHDTRTTPASYRAPYGGSSNISEYDKSQPALRKQQCRGSGSAAQFKGFTSALPGNDMGYDDLESKRTRYVPHPEPDPRSYKPMTSSSLYEPASATSSRFRYPQPPPSSYRDHATHHAPYADDYPPESIRGAGANRYSNVDNLDSVSRRGADCEPSWDEASGSWYDDQYRSENSLSPKTFKKECQRAYKEARAQRMRNLEEGLYGKCDWATFDSKYC